MKITALVENRSDCALKTAHGLSLYIETPGHKILFDVGPDKTIFENSGLLGINLEEIDTVIISHGHYDHGGALEQLLQINTTARVYVQRRAFERHYSKILLAKVNIGIAAHLQTHPQVILLDGDYIIDDELILLTTPGTAKYRSEANDTLYSEKGKDDFSHEQSLMITGDTCVLIMGCGHAGAVNILEKAAIYNPGVCIGGYHLWNPTTKKTVSKELLDDIAGKLAKREIRYYTCHCTGREAYDYLAQRVPEMNYLSCGETICVT